MTQPTKEQIEAALLHSYDLDKKVPDMRQRGFRIETGYGEIDIDAEESCVIANHVERILTDRCARALGQTPGVHTLSADQRFMVETFEMCDQDRQNFILLMSHLGEGKPCTPEMSQLLTRLGDIVVFGGVPA